MNNSVGWFHPHDEADEFEGFADSGVEHFTGQPVLHLAREVIQNSLDAKAEGCVRVRFHRIEVSTSSIPGLESLKGHIEACIELATRRNNEKAVSFFQRATEYLARPKIYLLMVTDHNTTGAVGPCKEGTAYHALMKAAGESEKSAVGGPAGGSYGIGKNAPYANSALRTLFISTIYNDNGGFVQLTQGKSILMSHDVEGKRRKAKGYWGNPTLCQPVEGVPSDCPEWLLRASSESELVDNCGTNLCVLGFYPEAGWEQVLAASVASNYFQAIYKNELAVEINGLYDVTDRTINDIFSNEDIIEFVDNMSNDDKYKFEAAREYYQTISVSDDVDVFDHQNTHLGNCRIRIRVSDGLPKKVCAVRNGMMITDQVPFLKRFYDCKDFIAVLECLDDAGNTLLRNMEPPCHDAFEPDRLIDPAKGRVALKQLTNWVRDMLKRVAQNPLKPVSQLDELRDYLPDESDEESGDFGEEVNPVGEIRIEAKPIKVRSRKVAARKGEIPSYDPGAGPGGRKPKGKPSSRGEGSGGGDGGGTGTGGGGSSQPKAFGPVPLWDFRGIPTGPRSRKIAFGASVVGRLQIQILEAGADEDYPIEVTYSSRGSVEDGKIIVDVDAEGRTLLDIELAEPYAGSLKVIANEV